MSSFDALLGAVLKPGLTLVSRVRRPPINGRLVLNGLRAPVEVIRDRWGVPHIYAHSDRDALFAQGFVHAQDRLWQLDFCRRMVAGRLAEILGEPALALDRWLRITTMRRVAEQEAAQLSAGVRAEAEAYAAGINAYIARGRLPIEFTLLGYRPEPWTPADSLAWVKYMSWNLSVNWETELLRAQLIARLGADRVAELEPPYFDRWPTIVPPGVDWSTLREAMAGDGEAATPYAWPSPLAGLGSNSWVIAGNRTASGRPLLANDMHLPMLIPAIWYENHLVGEALNVTGVTFPGIPGVVAGHNEHVAWGFTNGFADVQDLYVERLRRTGDSEARVQAERNGDWYDAQVYHETIRVRRGQPVDVEVVVTRHGPIINGLSDAFTAEPPLALRWTSLEPDAMLAGLLAMNRARNCAEFRQALRQFSAPVQNVVYADAHGDIAYSLPGKIPIRAAGDGRLPSPGWADEHEWTGYIPFDELPHLLNPPAGYIVTANNRVVGDDYPHYLGRETIMGDRAQRIVEMIERRTRLDVADCRAMQLDQLSPTARVVAGHLGNLDVDHPQLDRVVQLIRNWDGTLRPDSAAAAIYEAFLRQVIPLLLERHLGPAAASTAPGDGVGCGETDLVARYAGRGPTPMVLPRTIFGERSLEWLQRTLIQPDSPWFDLGHGETRDDVLCLALRRTLDVLTRRLGPDMSGWEWGQLHTLTLSHPLGTARPLAPLFNRGPLPVGGDASTVWATGANQHDLDSTDVIAPPCRMIVDVGAWDNSLAVLAPGQSGDPGSLHYDDQLAGWFSGDYHPMLFARERVEGEAEARLTLLPP